MAKLRISRKGEPEFEVELSQERMSLGRHPANDIVLPHRAVSARHCVFTCILDDCFLEDLDSTNGSFVNGKRVLKHVLQDGDQITLAVYQVQFVAGPRVPAAAPLAAMKAAAIQTVMAAQQPAAVEGPLGQILVENGGNAGKTLLLNKPLTTLGRPGVMVVVINRVPSGYTVAHLDGAAPPLLNGQPMPPQQAVPLQPGDVLDLGGTRMAFALAPLGTQVA